MCLCRACKQQRRKNVSYAHQRNFQDSFVAFSFLLGILSVTCTIQTLSLMIFFYHCIFIGLIDNSLRYKQGRESCWHWHGVVIAPLAVGWFANGWAISNVCLVSVIAFRTKPYWFLFQHFIEIVVSMNEAYPWPHDLSSVFTGTDTVFRGNRDKLFCRFEGAERHCVQGIIVIQCSSIFAGCVLRIAWP